MSHGFLRAICLGLITLLLTACGAGGGNGGGMQASGGTGGTGISFGTITSANTASGTVAVNGVDFSTNGATVLINKQTATVSDLQVGMLVTINGDINGTVGTAMQIKVDETVQGLIEQVPDANHWVVMGQTVLIDALTQFKSFTLPVTPVVGQFVEVHGHVVGDGVIAAGFIERKFAVPSQFAVKGLIENHDSSAKTFTIGTLSVDYTAANISNMPDPVNPLNSWNTLEVEAKGFPCGSSICGTLTGMSVEQSGLIGEDADEAQVEGYVTDFGAMGVFVVGYQDVVATSSTVFEGGVATDIARGVKLEVEGVLSGGVVTAKKVSFRDNIRLEGDITALNTGAGTLTLVGLPSIAVAVNGVTSFKGGPSSLNDFALGNHVRIRARAGGGNNAIALEIEKRSSSPDPTKVMLQGPVSVISSPTLKILGVTVDTSAFGPTNFKDANDQPIAGGQSAFFSLLKLSELVKASGSLSGSSVTWSEVELEN